MTILTAHRVSWRREGYARWVEPETHVLADARLNVFAVVERSGDGWLARRTGEPWKFYPEDGIEAARDRLQRFVEKNPGTRPMN